MIVMATTRPDHRGLEHLVAGSTAERVTQLAKIAVLLIRVKGSQERQPEVSNH
jgi:nucleotide-binding universal stress UspA family protein